MSQSEVFQNTKKLIAFLKMGRVNMWFLALSVIFSFCFSLLALYAAQLLLPLTGGILRGDFKHVGHLPVLRFFVMRFPGLFRTSTRLFALLVVWFYLVTIAKNVFLYFASFCSQTQARYATANIRRLLVEKCLSYSKSFYDKNTTAFLQTVLTKATSLIESQFQLFQHFIVQALLLVAYISMMAHLSWKLTCVAAVAFPLTEFLTQNIIRRIREASREHDRYAKNLHERIFNMLYCMPVIRSFVKEREEIARFSKASEEEVDHSFKTQRLTSLAGPVSDLGSVTGILCLAFGLAIVMKFDHAPDPSQAFVFFYLAMRVIPGFNAINTFKLGSANAASAIHDIEQVLYHKGHAGVESGSVEFTGLKKAIEFRELSFRYGEKEAYVLDKVNFSIPRQSVVAIVGPSGSGKSTLVNLLLRFYDCPPEAIFVDGRDIRDYEIASLRGRMALISQEVLLFNDTIRNNIVYGVSGEISEERLHELGGKVQIQDFVGKMPQKYETLVGERGTRLSGGERQRLSIARALIKDPEILIMDEATSALDSGTEARINEFILETSREKTLIVIAHRLSTIRKANKIIYLDKGRVAESGTLTELIDRKGLFYKQWQAQKL
ncbi:MAG TPA: ABC transporter ATP-binding protein [Candidatus Omnitrophota bacterium]|nr:ABC transporter ATP-binding protein [Candidatus Omnitrophota bacterium]HPS36295.1 ABC transporter ATP-binding protein [Candidatus Omnitrophota bacterium]